MAFVIQEIYDFTVSIWVELFFVFCFGVGFSVLQMTKFKASKRTSKSSKGKNAFKAVHAKATSDNAASAVAAWRAVKGKELAPIDTLKVVAQALLEAEPSSAATEILGHFSLHASHFADGKAATAVLEVVAQAGKEDVMEELFKSFTRQLCIPVTVHMNEVLLGGHASAGNEKKVAQLVAQMRERRQKVTVRGYALMVKGFLKNDMLDAAMAQIKEMRAHGLKVPPFAVSGLFRVARDSGRTAEVLQSVQQEVSMTMEALALVAEDCLKSQDLALAKSMEKIARDTKVQMNFTTYEALLKLHASAGDMHALELFQEVQQSFSYISDGLCVSLIVRCAEPKFLNFAEAVVAFVRSHSKMTIVMYSALMKVYSYANMYSQASDLYEQICADGLEPDNMMYGCLVNFSAACGRTALAKELSAKVPGCDIHHQMALIRAAGQEKDVNGAVSILENLKASGGQLDTVVYNAVLDVCSSAGNMKRARTLIVEMRQASLIDTVSYNTLLKGYCMQNDIREAKQVMVEMEQVGLPANEISYNCLINAAASMGDFNLAWASIETMERKGVCIDNYTVSTMMKALKNTQASKSAVSKVMALLDRHGLDVCGEEVLLNTVLEACIKHYEHWRLESILALVEAKKPGKLSVHTYATLIRASGILKRMQRCRQLWAEMTELYGLEPNEVALGCMLDALVNSGGVVEGVALLRKWQGRVRANTVLYSTLIKGFTNIRNTKGADEMWRELCANDLPLNTMVYNAIIDAHARVGNMDEVTALLKSMEVDGCKADDITYSMIAKGYCVTGNLDKALEIFHSLPSKPNPNTVVVYNTLLDGCVRHNRSDIADNMLENMQKWGIKPSNFTLGIIVKMWGRRRQIKKAFAAVHALPKQYGFVPNVPVQTCLLFACLRNDAVDEALEVYHGLRAAGHPTEAKLISALIGNCARTGKLEQAVSLVEEAYGLANGTKRVIQSGEELDSASLEQLLKALSQERLMQKIGAPLLQKMRTAKIPVSNRLLTMTVREV